MCIHSVLVNETVGKRMEVKVQVLSYQSETLDQFQEEYNLQ